jgi:hypothetical protein
MPSSSHNGFIVHIDYKLLMHRSLPACRGDRVSELDNRGRIEQLVDRSDALYRRLPAPNYLGGWRTPLEAITTLPAC